MGISVIERGILYNQFEILKKLYPDDSSYYETSQKTIEYGTESEIKNIWHFDEEPTSDSLAREVHDILSMYWSLRCSYRDLEDKADICERDITFRGFDGNEEIEHYVYAKYLVEDLGRYPEFKDKDLNSHCPTLSRYKTMLSKYKEIDNQHGTFKNSLSADEIKYIID